LSHTSIAEKKFHPVTLKYNNLWPWSSNTT